MGAPTPNGGLDLTRVSELQNSKLSSPEKAKLGLRLYRDEMVSPTPRPGPPYLDYHTHDYVLAQITQKLAEVDADVPTLKKTWESANPGEVKDSLAIFLVLKNQPEAKDAVAKYVVDRNHPMRLRELGVIALGQMAVKTEDVKLGDVLAQVVREDNQTQYKMVPDPKTKKSELYWTYPVRKAGVEAIKKMEKAGMLLPSYVTQAPDRAQTEMKVPAAPASAKASLKPATKPAPGK